jgi:hypothetical protein
MNIAVGGKGSDPVNPLGRIAMAESPSEDGRGRPAPPPSHDPPPRRRRGYERESIGETMAKSFIRSIAGRLGRAIARMIVGRSR